ncbi:hypothetical protein [Plebeiibacterium sediminum]|uniref:MetA-pathway of phenol degradation n=1 Tax=Plebeiibacterium sediminum TaxID=2992112 RepID=A0AAE3SDD1_9BACT|nr:hypothetical protein [Plebeiobacterium sediminum]MCW3784846.1 hypothetical protein [Plebeiobacterium sediminum]
MNLTQTLPKLALLAILLALHFHCHTQNPILLSNKSLAQGGTGVAEKGYSSIHSNPSGSAYITNSSVSANYHMPYFTKEISSQNISLISPTKLGVFHSIISRYGYKYYNESFFTLGYAKPFSEKFSISFQLNLQHNQIPESGNGSQLFSSFGFIFSPHPHLNIGFFTLNPEKSKIKIAQETETIDSYFNLGFRWNATDQFAISSEISHQISYSTITRFGLEYKINKTIRTRAGIYGKPISYTMGLGITINNFTIDSSLANHMVLGLSSGIGVSYTIKTKQ